MKIKKIFSLFLAAIMLFGCLSFSVAETDGDPESAPEAVETVEIPEETSGADADYQPSEPEEAAADGNPEEGPVQDADTAATDGPEEEFIPCTLTEGCILEDGHEGECVPGEEQPEEVLPYGFKGMPEGYELNAKQMAFKAAAKEYGMAADAENSSEGEDYVTGEILYMAGDEKEAAVIAEAYNAELLSFRNGVSRARLNGEATVVQAVECGADETLNLPAVEPNYYIQLDPVINTGDPKKPQVSASSIAVPEKTTWKDYKDSDPFLKDPQNCNLKNNENCPYQWQHDTVNSYEAWSVTKGDSVIVAVLDTGVDTDHPDLAGKVTEKIGPADSNGHGTHVAGIIGAILDNGEGGSGIAPNAEIYSYNVLPRPGGRGTTEDIVNGITGAIEDGVDIISMSLGSPHRSIVEAEAIQQAYESGITVIAAMGNNGSNTVCFPAYYDHVIAVGAVDKDGKRAFFSNYGKWCDISAPGVDILSTVPESYRYAFTNGNGTYAYMSGTSQATPVVSGVLALYMSKVGNVGPDKALAKLKTCVNKCASEGMGAGIIDAAKLFEKDKTKPVITVMNGEEPVASFKTAVPYESILTIARPADATNDKMIIWSVGEKPVVKDGIVTVGEKYTGPVDLKAWAGKKITVYAACISGMGVMSTVASVTLTVSANPSPAGVTVSAPQMLFSGKSATLTASVSPADSAQAVTWSIALPADGSAAGTKISAQGVLTAKASAVCTVNVTATVKENPAASDTVPVVLRPAETRKVVLAASTLRMENGQQTLLNLDGVYKVDGKTEALIDPDRTPAEGGYELAVSSSNSKVVSVGEDNTLQAVGNGTAKISVSLKDGSAKAAVLNVTVFTPVQTIKIIAPKKAVAGKSFTVKAEIEPSTASNKAVTWKVVDGPAKITSNGKVTVNKNAAPGSYVLVSPTLKDGSRAQVEGGAIDIVSAADSFQIEEDRYRGGKIYGVNYTSGSDGSLSKVTLFNVDLPANEIFVENAFPVNIRLIREGAQVPADDIQSQVQITSSNNKVVTVDEDGTIRAVGKGTANVTYALTDGSNLKKTVKVTVRIPASSLTITSSANRMLYDTPTIAAGCSAKHTISFGDGFGKPDTKASDVTWSVDLFTRDSSTGLYNLPLKDEDALANVSINKKTGALSVKKGIAAYTGTSGYDLQIAVRACAGDGSDVQKVIRYDVVRDKGSRIIPCQETVEAKADGFAYSYFRVDGWSYDITVTSSDPEVSSFYKMEGYSGDTMDNWKDDDGNEYDHSLMRLRLAWNKPGTATITVLLNDGSNTKCTFKVHVPKEF